MQQTDVKVNFIKIKIMSYVMNKIEELSIDSILVNNENPRFDPVVDQEAAIDMMLNVQGAEMKNLARDIAENGLNPASIIIVSKYSKNKFITLEGNRRIICLRLLHDPINTSNNEMRIFFSDLKKTYPNIQTTVSCFVTESKDDVFHWIKLIHTGKNQGVGVSPWNSEQKTRYLQSQQMYTARFHKAYQIFEYADTKSVKRDGVKISNLDRLIQTPQVCKAIGISFPNKKLKIINETKFIANLKKIFQAMSEESFTVRVIDTRDARIRWIHKIMNPTTKSKHPSDSASSKESSKSTSRKRLIPSDCNLIIKPSKIRNIFLELKYDLLLDNSQKATPNAAGVLFRVFLEVSVDHYLKNTAKIDIETLTLPKKIKRTADYMEKTSIASEYQLNAVRQLIDDRITTVLHVRRFHELVHSTMISPISHDLKERWDNLQEFMVILWNNVDNDD